MKTSTKFAIVSIVFAIISFGLSRVIWPDAPGMPGPSDNLLPFFIFISALESAAFGVGVSFACFGWKHIRAVLPADKTGATLWFIALTWMLVSWWPHDNMHRVNPMNDFAGLLHIEFMFHFTLIIATFVLARYFWKIISEKKVL